MNDSQNDRFGEPDLQLAGLRIWIHGRQFPNATDYWDGNWLNTTACYSRAGSIVHATGALKGQANLPCIEPNLSVELQAETGGKITAKILITPDHLVETHQFFDDIDQSYLPPAIDSCKRILEQYPVLSPQDYDK